MANLSKEMIFKIYGMDCVSCARGIKNSLLRRMEQNIEFIDIDFQTQKMFIKLKNGISPQTVIQEIKNLGYDAKLEEEITQTEEDTNKLQIVNVVSALIFASIIFILSMFFLHLVHNNKTIKTLILILSTFVQFVNGFKFYRNAFYGLKNGILNMDLLIVLSTTTAYFYSLYGYFAGFEHLYFETSAVIIAVVLLGKYIEEKYKKKGRLSILNLLLYKPQKVNLYKDGEILTIDVEQIKEGDIIEVSKGQSVPVDGKIIEGSAIFDLNLIFGENQPVELKKGDQVAAGTIIVDGLVKIQATCDYKNSFWKGIESAVYNLNTKTSTYQRFIDKFSGNFVILVVIFAVSSFIFWYLTGNKSFAFNTLISTLVIACPCAIGLASPLAINKGMLETSKRKIIVKDPYVFEKISKSVNFVFDKTGTITNKNLSVNRIKILLNNSEDDSFWQELTLLTVSKSKHPISLAIKEYLQNSFKANLSKASTKYTLQNFKELTSQGLIAQFDKLVVILGNKSLISENILNIENFDNNLLEDYDTFILILEDKTENKDVLVFIGIEYLEQLNEDIEDVFRIIEKKGSNIYILTGAGEKSALKLTQQIKIEPQKIIHSVDAVKKTEVINNIKSKGLTVFVGDGLNDSLVMNTADVGISFEYGSDITQNSASVILKNISQLKDLIVISQEVFKKLKFNLVWVFGYNVLFIPVAMGIFSGWGITISPILAAIAMVLSDFSLLFFNLTNLLPVKSK